MERAIESFMKYQSDAEEKFMKWEEERWEKEMEMEEKRRREDREHEMTLSNDRADVEALGKPLCNQLPSIAI